jgi:5-formyltetrahydrofolate cyclo-ligase
MTKSELRKIYLAKQKNLSEAIRNRKSQQIAHHFFQSFDLSKINFIHCFLPLKRTNEIETNFIFQKLWQNFPQIETLVPRVNFQTNEIENLKYRKETKLVQNIWQIDEPETDELVENERVDLVLAPLLCFDTRGFRVGYGKGFYDKFLSKCRKDCIKIGLSFFSPVKEISDINEHDIALDYCQTPQKVFKLKK